MSAAFVASEFGLYQVEFSSDGNRCRSECVLWFVSGFFRLWLLVVKSCIEVLVKCDSFGSSVFSDSIVVLWERFRIS